MTSRSPTRILVLAVASCLALAVPALAAADDGERKDVRKAGSCTGASRATLRLTADDDEIRVELRIEQKTKARSSWRVIVLHERRIAFRGTVRTRSGSRSLRVRRTVANWFGRDTIVVRASGPGAETCRASASV